MCFKVVIRIFFVKDMVIPKELRDIVSSPSYRVKQLKVEISKSFTTHEFIELVDSLLWISPRLELLLITHGEWIDKNWYRETISFKVLRILISLEFINLLHIFSLLGMVNKLLTLKKAINVKSFMYSC